MINKHLRNQLAVKAIKEYDDAVANAMNEYVNPTRATRPYIQNAMRKRTKDEAVKQVANSSAKRHYDKFAGALFHIDRSNNTFK